MIWDSNRFFSLNLALALILAVIVSFLVFPYGPPGKERVALQNFERYGYIALSGAFLIQTDPLSPDELRNPERFQGHSTVTLLPAHLWTQISGSYFAGGLLAACSLAMCFFVVFRHVCGSAWGGFVTLAVLACPGFWRTGFMADPVPLSLYWSLPAFYFFAHTILSTGPSEKRATLVVATTLLAFAGIFNWTVVIAFAVWSPVFLLSIFVNRQQLLRVLFPLVIVGSVSAITALYWTLDKTGYWEGVRAVHLSEYLTGQGRYSDSATWRAFVLRVGVVVGVGFFPLILLLAVHLRLRSRYSISALVLQASPLLVASAIMIVLRNYSTHAQWSVAAPILFHGFLASLFLAFHTSENPARVGVSSIPLLPWPRTLRVLLAGYGIFWAFLFHTQVAATARAFSMVHESTNFQDLLLFENFTPAFGRREDDGYLIDLSLRLARDIYCVSLLDPDHIPAERNVFLLKADTRPDSNDAQSGMPDLLSKAMGWYLQNISRRKHEGITDPGLHWEVVPVPPGSATDEEHP